MRKFKTESKKLLDLMINSIYTNREIFLRELISNASDAVDKLYFLSLTDNTIQLSKDELKIRVTFDEEARTITVSDSGIGMTESELDKNLGTIAHSGSQLFREENDFSDTDAADIIGQFGVGFYSSFMVAQDVKVITKAYGEDQAYMWESDGVTGYTISPAEREGHGTDIILTLKDNTEEDDYDQYLNEHTLYSLIKQYSNYVRYPIYMDITKSRAVPKPEDAGDDYVTEYEDYTEEEVINSMIPIWKRRRSDVTDEEYDEFYKSDFHDFSDPQRVISVHAEGALSYDALMFIPSRPPFDMYSRDYEKGLALYSSGVLIMDKCADLLPDYYNFVRGVVDSSDLALNISRETLQRNSQLRAIANKVEKKITSELERMRDNDRDDYELFFGNFGRSIKFGIYQDYGMKAPELAPLLLFYSAALDKLVTLNEYVEAMPEDQKDIYYAAGESLDRLRYLPMVKTIRSKNYDVLLCTEDVDEFVLQMIGTWKDKALKNVSTSDVDLASEDEKKVAEEQTEQNKDLFAAMQEILAHDVAKIEVSPTSMETPARLAALGQISLEMERILSRTPDGSMARAEKVLQLNAEHPVFETLKTIFAEDDKAKLRLYTNLLYNQALLVEGLSIDDPLAFAQDISQLM